MTGATVSATTGNTPAGHTPQQATAPAPDHRSGARACECSAWTDLHGQGTGCQATTRRLYSQGHDARFASWLAQQQAAGAQVRRAGGVPVTPAEAATTVGLGYDIEQRAARLAASRKPPRRAASRETEPQQPATATIRIGRWSYDNATIAPSGEAHYRTKAGDQKTAAPGSYKLVAAGGGAR